MGAYRLKIDLLELNPPCSRTIVVPDNFSFRELAEAINAAFEWWEGHVYTFEILEDKGKILEITDYGDEMGLERWKSEDTRIRKYIGKPITYVYDQGDHWVHRIALECEMKDYDRPYPTLDAFEGRSPPEDSGGPGGYDHLLEVLADPDDPDHDHLSAWAELMGFRDPVPEDINAALCNLGDTGEDSSYRGVLGPYLLPGDSFWDDMDKYRGKDPGTKKHVECDIPFPFYKSMSPEQLDWYLSWRSACERGEIVQTDFGYLWLYLTELVDHEDWESAIAQMGALAEAFHEPRAMTLLNYTELDLKNAHKTVEDVSELPPRFDWYDAARYFYSDPLPDLPSEEAQMMVRFNEKYCAGREEEAVDLIRYALSAMDAYCRSVHGKDVLSTLYDEEWVSYYEWLPSRRPRTFFRNVKGCHALLSIGTCAIARMWRIDNPRGGPHVRPPLDKEFVDLIDRAVKDRVAGKPFDPANYSR